MIVIMSSKASKQAVDSVLKELSEHGLKADISVGVDSTIIGMVGDTKSINKDKILLMDEVLKVIPVQEPYKKTNRKFHPEDTIVNVGDVSVGGKKLVVMAGPCSIENSEQMDEVGDRITKAGATILRGGAFKPRSSPYSFQGLERMGLDLMIETSQKYKIPVVSEITSVRHLEMFESEVDIIQIGARNMQNFELLKEVGHTRKPVLLKRGLSSTIEEWLMSAEYLLAGGNKNVILCERGIRTFESYTRNTLDLSAVVAVKKISHLPVVVDPSHATGHYWMVEPLSLAAIAAGADGLIIEVHNNPAKALCDGPQSLTPDSFDQLMDKIKKVAPLFGREL